MKLYMKQKVFSWNSKFFVRNENGEECCRVEGEIFSWGHKLHVYDNAGNEIAFIGQEIMHLMPTYVVWQNGVQVARIVRKFTWLRPRYELEGTDWAIDGNVWEHDYRITDGGEEIASISKEWFSWGDSYCVDVARSEDAIIALCIALVVDCVLATGDT